MIHASTKGFAALALASFEAAAQFCPGLSPWVFTDVPSTHPFCADITWLAQRGVTLGCAAINATQRLYCPEQSVRRDQMAAFMHRLGDAVQPTTCATGQVMRWDGAKWACAGVLASLSQGSGIVLSPNPVIASGTIAADTTYLQRRVAGSCTAGSSIRAINADGSVACESDDSGPPNAFVQGGNAFTTTAVLGTTSNQPVEIVANGGRVMRYAPHAVSPNILGGSPANNVTGDIRGATIAGGGAIPGSEPLFGDVAANFVTDAYGTVGGGYGNRAGDDSASTTSTPFATVAGGYTNVASGAYSTIGGGGGNTASSASSTVAGGAGNVATGVGSVVAGGSDNTASGHSSAVLGGRTNRATADFSVAMGRRAWVLTNAPGSFVFSDGTDADFFSGTPNEFLVAASGGIGLYTNKNYSTYCRIDPGGGSWNCSSSREVKRDFEPVDTRDALERVASLSLTSWRFVNEPGDVRHLGPMAEDFRMAFGLGSDARSISSVDAQGVALAAIQGLNAKLEQRLHDKDAEIAALRSRLEEIERTLAATLVPARHVRVR